MNIIDAVKSGKRIKRSSWKSKDYWNPLNFDLEDIIATDWEIEERKIEITESEFDEIILEVSKTCEVYHLALIKVKERLFYK